MGSTDRQGQNFNTDISGVFLTDGRASSAPEHAICQSPNWTFPHFQTCLSGRLIVRLPYSSRFGTRHRMLINSVVPHLLQGNRGSCARWSGE